jgi:hypothetical protein
MNYNFSRDELNTVFIDIDTQRFLTIVIILSQINRNYKHVMIFMGTELQSKTIKQTRIIKMLKFLGLE